MWSENQMGSQPKLNNLIAVSEQNVTGFSKAASSGLQRDTRIFGNTV